MDQVRIACSTGFTLPLSELHIIQGDLKSLSKESYDALKKEILETGYAFAQHVWWDHRQAKWCLVDGTQRFKTLRQMASEGFEIPDLPVVKVEAEDLDEAMRRVLQGTSQYGEMTSEGLYEFVEKNEFPINELTQFRFPEVPIVPFLEEFYDVVAVDETSGKPPEEPVGQRIIMCPHCGGSFDPKKAGKPT